MTPTDTVVSEERLREIVDGFTGLEVCADSDRLGPDEARAIARELLDRRTATPQSGGVVDGLRQEAAFLLARLDDLEWTGDEEVFRDFAGHVEPSAARLRMILSTLADPIPEAPADASQSSHIAQPLADLFGDAFRAITDLNRLVDDLAAAERKRAALRSRSTETDKAPR